MILDKDTINYLKNHKNQITIELLNELRKTKEGKQIAIDILETEKDEEEYYLDAFNNRISFNGNRQIKKAYTKMNLSEIHLKEIEKCSQDIEYFKNNYVKIKTPKGVGFPDLRPYQDRFIKELTTDQESYVVLFPRQCIDGDTLLKIRKNNQIYDVKIKDIYNEQSKRALCNPDFISKFVSDYYVQTPLGYQRIEFIHKTKDIKAIKITFDNNQEIICALNHVFIDENDQEIYAKDSLNRNIKTIVNSAKVLKIEKVKNRCFYDISLYNQHINQLYYTNGILSHNSGKSITTAIYLCWLFVFSKDINIGIAANRGKTARDFLLNVKNIFTLLPIWLQQGIKVWNAGSIYSENNVGILTDATNSNSFRGASINTLIVDELAYIPANDFWGFSESILPSQSSLAWKKNIFLSTPNGINHFYDIVEGARQNKYLDNISEDTLKTIEKSKIINITKNSNNTYNVELNEPSNDYKLITVDWKEVPRYDSKGRKLTPEEFKQKIIAKNGIMHFLSAYACEFIGSSYTLISSDRLKELKPQKPIDYYHIVNSDCIFNVYKEVEENHKYILAVDPAKDGQDSFAMQLIDITKFPFEQVGSAKLQVDYLLMPSFICDTGNIYNNAYIIIENNEGAGQSIADTLFRDYDYSNLYFDKDSKNRNKKYPGFRTTSKSRSQLLNTLKLLIENKKLIINDNNTIKELFTFILKNNKFQADDGFHDDMVMSLALAFCIFANVDNFEDMKDMIDIIYNNNNNNFEFTDILTVGAFGDFNDSSDGSDDFKDFYGI